MNTLDGLRTCSERRWVAPAALVVLLLGSFVLMIQNVAAGAQTWSFYMPWCRTWEFLAGGLAVHHRMQIGIAATR